MRFSKIILKENMAAGLGTFSSMATSSNVRDPMYYSMDRRPSILKDNPVYDPKENLRKVIRMNRLKRIGR